MTDEPINLNKARAEKANDARLWTPLDALKDLVAEIEAGRETVDGLSINFWRTLPDGGKQHGYVVAGLTRPENIALLEVSKMRAIDDWTR